MESRLLYPFSQTILDTDPCLLYIILNDPIFHAVLRCVIINIKVCLNAVRTFVFAPFGLAHGAVAPLVVRDGLLQFHNAEFGFL